jgi:hypothetical protein
MKVLFDCQVLSALILNMEEGYVYCSKPINFDVGTSGILVQVLNAVYSIQNHIVK